MLPLVPDEEIDVLGGVNPRQIWLMVVLVSGISLVGYVSLRLLGERGIELTGVLGGLVSSTAVTLGFSRLGAREPSLTATLAAGVLAAAAMMYARVVVEAFVVEPDLAWAVLPPMALLIAITGVGLLLALRSPRPSHDHEPVEVGNPLGLLPALEFAALFGAVLVVSEALLDRAPDSALYLVSALAGLTDVDAITLSTANLVDDGLSSEVGAATVLVGVTTNTALKGLLVAAIGGRRMARRVALAFVPTVLVGGAWAAVLAW